MQGLGNAMIVSTPTVIDGGWKGFRAIKGPSMQSGGQSKNSGVSTS